MKTISTFDVHIIFVSYHIARPFTDECHSATFVLRTFSYFYFLFFSLLPFENHFCVFLFLSFVQYRTSLSSKSETFFLNLN